MDGSRVKQNHPKLKRNRKHQHHRNETTTAIKLNSILLVCQTEFLKETVFLRSNSMQYFVFCVLCQIFERLRFWTGTSTSTRNTLNLYIFIKFHIPVVVDMNAILKIILNVNKCLKNLFFLSLSRDRYLNNIIVYSSFLHRYHEFLTQCKIWHWWQSKIIN